MWWSDLFEYWSQIAMWVEHLTRESRELGSKSFSGLSLFPHPFTILSKVKSRDKIMHRFVYFKFSLYYCWQNIRLKKVINYLLKFLYISLCLSGSQTCWDRDSGNRSPRIAAPVLYIQKPGYNVLTKGRSRRGHGVVHRGIQINLIGLCASRWSNFRFSQSLFLNRK